MNEKKDWLWIDSFLILLRFMVYISGIVYFFIHPEDLKTVPYSILVIALVIACVVPMIFYQPRYFNYWLYTCTEFICTAGIGIYFYIIMNVVTGNGLFVAPAMLAGFLTSRRNIKWTLPAFAMLLPATQYWAFENYLDFIFSIVDPILFYWIGYSLNYILQSNLKNRRLLVENRKQYELIQEQNKALEQYAKQIEHLTLIEERNRLAHELHDTIGHRFTSVIMGMDAVSYLIDSSPAEAQEKLTVLREVTRKGLDEIRTNIHQIAPSEMDTLLSYELNKIAFDFASHTGTEIDFQIEGDELPVNYSIRMAFIRCLQEALTNAKRHGFASLITITLVFETDELILYVENNGAKMEEFNVGFGLRGMSERIERLQGKIEIVNGENNGIVLICRVPNRRNFSLKV